MEMTVEVKLYSDDIRRILEEAAAKLIPQIDGYTAKVDYMPYMAEITVRLVKDADCEPAPESE